MPSLLQAATKVTKYRRRPRENNENFIIAELSTSINDVYTADVAKVQTLANFLTNSWRSFTRAGKVVTLHGYRPVAHGSGLRSEPI